MPESDPYSLAEGAGDAWLGLMLLAAGLALAPVATFLVRSLIPERRVFFARWGFSHVVQVVAATVLFFYAAKFLPLGSNPLALLGVQVLVFTGSCLVCWQFAKRCEVIGGRALGFPVGRDGRALGAGVVTYLFVMPVVLGAALLWPTLLDFLGGSPAPQAVMQTMLALEGADIVIGLLIAIAIQPLLEEILFRGFLQPLLVQNLSDRGGVIATSVLFALLHGPSAFLPVFVLSLALGGVMLRTRRISAAWLVHALHNATMFAVASSAESAAIL